LLRNARLIDTDNFDISMFAYVTELY
jgi:hypothetical protein